MSEPTIDEMLAWLDRFDWTGWNIPKAIRAILEQHRDLQAYVERVEKLWDEHDQRELEAIRAFVERVEQQVESYSPPEAARRWLRLYSEAFKDELAKMEREAQ